MVEHTKEIKSSNERTYHHCFSFPGTDLSTMAFLTTPKEVLVSNVAITTACSLLYILIRRRGAPTSGRKAMLLHNRIQILLSLAILSTTIACHLPPIIAAHLPLAASLRSRSCRAPRHLYHYSKFYEYLDVLLLILQGAGDRLGLHFAFHHLTTPWYTALRVLRDYGGWGLFAGLNAAHHLLSTFCFSFFPSVALFSSFCFPFPRNWNLSKSSHADAVRGDHWLGNEGQDSRWADAC
jgi:GNS1/SUR4 family